MKKTSALVLAVTILLAGCGGGAKPDPSPTSTNPASPATTLPTTSVPTSPSTSPGTIGPSIDPNIPAAARAHTPAGAEAFVRYFYMRVNEAWTNPKVGLISALSSAGCTSCDALETTATDLVKKRQRYDGLPVTILTIAGIGEDSPGRPKVVVQFIQEKRNVIDASGRVVMTDDRKRGKFVVTLGWTEHGWSFATVKSLP